MVHKEVIIIGAGPAGMAAAVKLSELGFRDVLILEKEERPGGVLRQCIHPGFGLIRFGKNLTGPEYSLEYEDRLSQCSAEVRYNTAVLKVSSGEKDIIRILARGPEETEEYSCDAAILASGCRERGRGSLMIPGSMPAGVFTAGTAQAMMNLQNARIGDRIVIVGSGDIGLIMARRFTLEGSRVLCVVEKEDVCGGLERNLKECLDDFSIPLLTGSEVVRIDGLKRVESVVIRDSTDEETSVECDTVILAAGLIPEDDFVEGSIPGLFYCGNVLYVHDLVDDVSESGENAAMDAAGYLLARMRGQDYYPEYGAETVPEIRRERTAFLKERRESKRRHPEDRFFITCIICPNSCRIDLRDFTGGQCPKGEIYARNEVEHPFRILTSTVLTERGEQISVRTNVPIPLEDFPKGMEALRFFTGPADVRPGQVLIKDFLRKGTDLLATVGSR